MTKRMFVLLLCLWLTTVAWAQGAPTLEANLSDSCVADFDPTVDYFPDKVEVQYSEKFNVTYFNHYKIVEMLPWAGAEEPMVYLLVQCGTPVPSEYQDLTTIEIPVQRFVSMSTTILPYLETQGVLDRLVGIDTAMYVSSEAVLARVAAGETAEVGGGGMGSINAEALLAVDADLVMAQQYFAGGTTLSELQAVGVPAVLNADYTDTSPLGQAEWGKYIALFFNTEAQANAVFDGVAERYEALRALTANVETRPTTIAASPFSGTWYMPAGSSTVAQLLADAGADFLFSDLEGTSVPLDIEVVLERGAEAEFWVNANQFWTTQADMLNEDARFAQFRAVTLGNVWNNNARMNANGGNDYFESGVANPDLILADLVAIFHPDLMPDHTFVYYRRLASGE